MSESEWNLKQDKINRYLDSLVETLGENYDASVMHQEVSMKTVNDVLSGTKVVNNFKYSTLKSPSRKIQ